MNKLKNKLLEKPKKTLAISADKMLSTGSTLLNLACSGSPFGGFLKGKYHLIVGDSSSGKTALSLTCLAEAAKSNRFDNYELVHDDVEGGALFNIKKLFGNTLAKRLQTVHSSTLEEMYYTIDNYLKKGKPFIYIVDSMDSLDTTDDEEKFQEQKKAHEKGKTTAGSYGTAKAKINSQNLRRLMTPLRDSGSILIMISQTRDNLGFGFEKKTRAGGKSLRFYATLEMWSSIAGKIKKNVKGKDRVIGIHSKIDIKKNRLTGQERSVVVPIYYSVGFDDVGSCIQYLVDEGHWKKTGSRINAEEFEQVGTLSSLINHIEENDLERRLQRIVGQVWNEIEEQCQVKRKARYV